MRNYQCRDKTETLIILYITKTESDNLLYIAIGENKHGNERIDLFGK